MLFLWRFLLLFKQWYQGIYDENCIMFIKDSSDNCGVTLLWLYRDVPDTWYLKSKI